MEEESRKSFAQITLYNQLIKEMDDLYRVYAKTVICRRRLSGFCIVSGNGKRGVYPEGDLRLLVLHAPDSEFRTENMTEEGLLILRAEEDNRKNKRIYLTEKGKETVERIVVPLMDAERRALAAIGEQEAEILLKTMKNIRNFSGKK